MCIYYFIFKPIEGPTQASFILKYNKTGFLVFFIVFIVFTLTIPFSIFCRFLIPLVWVVLLPLPSWFLVKMGYCKLSETPESTQPLLLFT